MKGGVRINMRKSKFFPFRLAEPDRGTRSFLNGNRIIVSTTNNGRWREKILFIDRLKRLSLVCFYEE